MPASQQHVHLSMQHHALCINYNTVGYVGQETIPDLEGDLCSNLGSMIRPSSQQLMQYNRSMMQYTENIIISGSLYLSLGALSMSRYTRYHLPSICQRERRWPISRVTSDEFELLTLTN